MFQEVGGGGKTARQGGESLCEGRGQRTIFGGMGSDLIMLPLRAALFADSWCRIFLTDMRDVSFGKLHGPLVPVRLDGAAVARLNKDSLLALMGDADGITLLGAALLDDRA